MNYGKKGSKKRQAELTSKGIMYGKKMRVIFCKVLLVCCFAVAIIGGSLWIGVYKAFWILRHPSMTSTQHLPVILQPC